MGAPFLISSLRRRHTKASYKRRMEGDVMETIAGIVIAVFASSGFWQYVLYKVQKRDRGKSAVDRALMYLLRQNLISRCDYWLDLDSIPINEWTSIVEENAIYHELGGNGDLKGRMDTLEAKPKTSK